MHKRGVLCGKVVQKFFFSFAHGLLHRCSKRLVSVFSFPQKTCRYAALPASFKHVFHTVYMFCTGFAQVFGLTGVSFAQSTCGAAGKNMSFLSSLPIVECLFCVLFAG